MKKIMKKMVSLLFVALLAIVLVACGGKEKEATGYGLVHGHYVGVVNLTVAKDKTVKSATIEEYFLPYNFAKVDAAKKDHADVLAADYRGNVVYYAKYVKVDDVLFTGAVSGEAPARVVTYSATGINNIEEWVKTEANAKKYVDAVEAKKVFIATSTGEKSTELTTLSTDNSAKSMKKSESGYWTPAQGGLGWKANMEEIVKGIVGTKLEGEAVKEGDTWKLGTVVTGATLNDFKDYIAVAKRAYATATSEK